MDFWTKMPQDIGHLILDKLPEVVEHVRFSATCKNWYMITKDYQRLHKHHRRALPMLLVPSLDAPTKPEPPTLYSLSSLGQSYQNLRLHHLPFSPFRYCGSSNGWIATQNEDFTVTLLYPFGSELLSIHLPRLRQGLGRGMKHDFHITKLIVTPESMPDDYTVVAIYGGRYIVTTIKSGEESWTDLDPGSFCFHDIISFKKKVYAITGFFAIVRVNIEARPLSKEVIHPWDYSLRYLKTYLVEATSSELFVLGRIHYHKQPYVGDGLVPAPVINAEPGDEDAILVVDDEDDDNDDDGSADEEWVPPPYNTVTLTEKFNVYKLKLDEGSGNVLEMVETKHLNGDTFFVGESESISFPARSFPGCKSDFIYFTDDLIFISHYDPNGPEDVGCYGVKDGSIDRFYKMHPSHRNNVPQPVWIVPRV